MEPDLANVLALANRRLHPGASKDETPTNSSRPGTPSLVPFLPDITASPGSTLVPECSINKDSLAIAPTALEAVVGLKALCNKASPEMFRALRCVPRDAVPVEMARVFAMAGQHLMNFAIIYDGVCKAEAKTLVELNQVKEERRKQELERDALGKEVEVLTEEVNFLREGLKEESSRRGLLESQISELEKENKKMKEEKIGMCERTEALEKDKKRMEAEAEAASSSFKSYLEHYMASYLIYGAKIGICQSRKRARESGFLIEEFDPVLDNQSEVVFVAPEPYSSFATRDGAQSTAPSLSAADRDQDYQDLGGAVGEDIAGDY